LSYSTFGAKRGDRIPIVEHLLNVALKEDIPLMVMYNGLELYGVMIKEGSRDESRLIVGPVLSVKPTALKNLGLLSFSAYFPEDKVRRYVKNIPLMSSAKFVHYLEVLYYSLTGRVARFDEIADGMLSIKSLPESLEIKLPETLFEGELPNFEPYTQDIFKLYELVKSGNVSDLEMLLENSALIRSKISQSSKENYTMFVASASFYGKAALDSGLELAEVHSIGSTFIKYADTIETAKDYYSLLHRMIVAYATRVQEEKARMQHPQSIIRAIDYIEQNLHFPLALDDVSKNVNLSRAYFSQLFSKEMGISLQSYINQRKIQEAEQLLRYSSMSIKEISELLAFCSQSYFTEVFKSFMQTTPIVFRKRIRDEK